MTFLISWVADGEIQYMRATDKKVAQKIKRNIKAIYNTVAEISEVKEESYAIIRAREIEMGIPR